MLPKLVKYTGSTKYGLDSKYVIANRGWANHDGESIKVEKVEQVERGSVRKSVKKAFSKKWSDQFQQCKAQKSLMFSSKGSPM